MHRARGGDAYDMVLVVCPPSEGHHPIFQVRTICHLSGIEIEKPRKNGLVGQCHRCQLYGHSQKHCHGRPRCVKCLGDHGTADCPRPKDRTLCTEPPSCVLCGESGHPANYRGCSKAPKKSSPKLNKRSDARQLRECPSGLPVPSSQLPTKLSPQRPSPWNRLNHQQAFPALVPSHPPPPPMPGLMDPRIRILSKPAPAPKAAPATLAAPSHPQSTPVVGGPSPVIDSFNIISGTFTTFFTPRAKQMANELVAARNAGDLFRIQSIYNAYPEITQALTTFTNNSNQ